jgi:uncharacterized protein (TIGR02246 family)
MGRPRQGETGSGIMKNMNSQTSVLLQILDRWAEAVRLHQTDLVASYFTEDAVFQGFDRTHTVGRPGVADYYDKQPVGLSPAFTVRELRPMSDDAFLAFVDVDFSRPTGEVIPVHLTLGLVRSDGAWLIQHYHVSKIET